MQKPQNRSYQIPLKYSQNFFINYNLIERIISNSTLAKNDTVYEIGPGKGILTKPLAQRVKSVIAVEKDPKLFEKFLRNIEGFENITPINQDFLTYNLPKKEDYKIFSNTPFSIISEILRKLFYSDNPPVESFLFLPKDVVLKLIGKPESNESQISIILKAFFEIRLVHRFSRKDFYPIPSVDIFMIKIAKRDKLLINQKDFKLYREFVTYGFNQWKSSLKKSFRKIFSNLQFKILSTNLLFDQNALPSELTIDQWIGLFEAFLKIVPKDKQHLVRGSEERFMEHQNRMRKKNFEILESQDASN
jgi:23S rRNA (adenine-N6)-dimethyltransferase